MLRYLNKVNGEAGALSGSTLLYSMWSGYKEKPNSRRLLEWAASKGISVLDLHTSGHADRATLQRIVTGLKPRTVVPIHTFRPGDYAAFGVDVRILSDGEELVL